MKRLFSIFFCILLFSAFSVVGFASSLSDEINSAFTYYPSGGGTLVFNDELRSSLASASVEVQKFFSRLEDNPSDFVMSAYNSPNGYVSFFEFSDVSNLSKSSITLFSSSYAHQLSFYKSVLCSGVRLDRGVASLYSDVRVVTGTNFTTGKILSGSYLDKSLFSSTFPANEFDTSMPVANVIVNGSYVEGKIVTVNYLDTDGAVVSPPVTISFPVGEEYSIASPSVVGHAPDQTVISGLMPNENLNFTVTYSPTPYQLSVNFVNDNGSQVAPPSTQTLFYNDTYSVACPPVVGYTPERESVAGVMPPNDFVDTVSYSFNSYILTINYLDSNGNSVHAPNVSSVKYGDNYNIISPIVDGLEAGTLSVLGTMPPNDYTVNVVYGKPMTEYDKMLASSLSDLSRVVSSNALVLCCVGVLLMTLLIIVILLVRILWKFSNV